MQLTNFNMINNTIKSAKFKLSQHKVQGETSTLSIFQVAKLMDMIKIGEEQSQKETTNILFSLN